MKKICKNSNNDLITSINLFLLSYRSTSHSSTSLSPAELLFNQKRRTRLTSLKTHINKIKDEERHLTSLKTIKTQIFYPGDLVWVRNFNKRENKWLERRTVKQLSSVIYLVQLKGHDSLLKTCQPSKVSTSNQNR